MKLNQLPWLKILIPFLLGILLSQYIDYKIPNLFLLVVLFGFSILNVVYKRYNKLILIISAFSIITIFGIAYTQIFQIKHQDKHFSKIKGNYLIGTISDVVEEKEKSFKTIISIHSVLDSLSIHQADGKLLTYFQKSDSFDVEIGDELIFPFVCNEIEPPKNINQFNYKNYLANNSIYFQTYIKENTYKIITPKKSYFILRKSNEISKYVQQILRKNIPNQSNFQIADGILLGHKADMDIEQYNTFAYLGIVHILSVSGLHVGIVYLLISFLLGFLPNSNKFVYWFKFILSFILIWLFAFVVGLSPAVVRAALLFSILHVGRILNKDTIPINVLFGAAFIQLLFNPFVIYNIGFQLSYLAMLGLFLFYQPIYSKVISSNKYVDWLSQMFSAGVAAQIFTLPLSIYYFGNFPTYALIANLFAVPLSTLILWFSIALIPFQIIPFVASLIGHGVSFLIDVFIALSNLLLKLPFAKINTLYIDKYQLILCFLALALMTATIIKQRLRFTVYALIVFCVVIGLAYFNQYQQYKTDKLIFYSIKDNLVFALHQNNKATIYCKKDISDKDYSFNISNAQRYFRNKFVQQTKIENDLYFVKDKSIYIINQNNINKQFQTPLNVDVLVLSDNFYLDVKKLQQNYQFKHLVLSSDLDYKHQNIFSRLLKNEAIPFTNLNKKSLTLKDL